jgi:hypothetical protein
LGVQRTEWAIEDVGLCELQRPPSALDSGIDKDPAGVRSVRGPPSLQNTKICFGLFRTDSLLLTKGSVLDLGVTASNYRRPHLSVYGGGGSVIDTTGCEIQKGALG